MTTPRVLDDAVRFDVTLPATDGVAVSAVRLDLDPALNGSLGRADALVCRARLAHRPVDGGRRSSRSGTTSGRPVSRTSGGPPRDVQQVLDTPDTDHPLAVAMTCGTLEENAVNNREMAAALSRTGHTVTYREVPDLHSYTAWRDALDPDLTALLASCW